MDRLGVAGSEGIALSSLLGGRLKSPVAGCGFEVVAEVEAETEEESNADAEGLLASDKERDLGERTG